MLSVHSFFSSFFSEWTERAPPGGQGGPCPGCPRASGARRENRLRHQEGKHSPAHRVTRRTGKKKYARIKIISHSLSLLMFETDQRNHCYPIEQFAISETLKKSIVLRIKFWDRRLLSASDIGE